MKKIPISAKNAEFQIIQALKTNRVKRHQSGEIFIEGIESIKQAAAARMNFTRIIIHNESGLSDWGGQFLRENKTRVIEMSFDLYKELCDRDEPSEMLLTAQVAPKTLQDLSLPRNPFLVIFDRPSDHGNFGALVRSANSFNVDAILVTGHGVDHYDPKVIRASLGSIFHTNIIPVPSTQELTDWLHAEKQRSGIRIIGTDSGGSVSLLDEPLQKPIVLILGNEAKGMSVTLKNMCDQIVSIPLSGAVNSLNVACAGSILLWDVYKNEIGRE